MNSVAALRSDKVNPYHFQSAVLPLCSSPALYTCLDCINHDSDQPVVTIMKKEQNLEPPLRPFVESQEWTKCFFLDSDRCIQIWLESTSTIYST